MEFKRAIPHDIHIQASANGGFIVNVGCATLAFKDATDLLEAAKQYLLMPQEMERRYNQAIGQQAAPRPVPYGPSGGLVPAAEARPAGSCCDDGCTQQPQTAGH